MLLRWLLIGVLNYVVGLKRVSKENGSCRIGFHCVPVYKCGDEVRVSLYRNSENVVKICGFTGFSLLVCCYNVKFDAVTNDSIIIPVDSHRLSVFHPTKSPIIARQDVAKPGEKSKAACRLYKEMRLNKKVKDADGKERYVMKECPKAGELPEALLLNKARVTREVVGGSDVIAHEFPHMALIGYRFSSFCNVCGGTLISNRVVMTAAHCIQKESCGELPNVVRLGEHNLNESKYETALFQEYTIQEIVTHPMYRPTPQYNDIALLVLNESVKLQSHIFPACLPSPDLELEDKAEGITIGWGNLMYGGNPAQVLQKVQIEVYNQVTCIEKLSKNRLIPEGVKDTQFCAGWVSGDRDACGGDSGGPFQTKLDGVCVYTVFGIVSFGLGCGDPKFPGIYTKVSKYIPWIESIVWQR